MYGLLVIVFLMVFMALWCLRLEVVFGIRSKAIDIYATRVDIKARDLKSPLPMILDLRKWTFKQFYPELVQP